MEPLKDQWASEAKGRKRRFALRKFVFVGLLLFVFIVVSVMAAIACNNVALWSDDTFAGRLDSAISRAEDWIEKHTSDILKGKNAALLTMLWECNDLKPNPSFRSIVESFLNEPMTHYSRCWKREVEPNWPIDKLELNMAIAKENIDNKWTLYAVAPDKADVNPEALDLFNPERWHRRQLTHQLFALTLLHDRHGSNERLDALIERLCERIHTDASFCVPVVDIYI
jgi:hypothetical protein